MSDEVVSRALGYPYPREPGAFVWRDGRVELFDGTIPAESVACVAYGSNASPQQLARKYSDFSGIEIPTVPAELLDYDVVYAALIAYYGSIPATIAPCPGARAKVWLQWLSPRALSRMDESEGVPWLYERTTGLPVVLEDGRPTVAFSYSAVDGPLLVAGKPAALAEVPASGRQFPELSQKEVQHTVRGILQVSGSVEEFIRKNVADPALRKARSEELSRLR